MFGYYGVIAAPSRCKTVYDGRGGRLKTKDIALCDDECFTVINPTRSINLRFRISDGFFCAIEGKVGALSAIPRAALQIPYHYDGSVQVRTGDVKPASGRFYLDFKPLSPCYDPNSGVLAFGAHSEEGYTFCVSSNVYLSIDGVGKLCGVYIQL